MPGKDVGLTGHILLAEDSPTNRMLATAILKGAGYEVTATANGRELLHAVRSEAFDLILMDIFMPEMDGLQATAAVRALPGTRSKIPIIAMTAYAVESDRERCLAAGMDDYVSKPIHKQELLEMVKRWLGKSIDAGVTRDSASGVDETLNAAVLESLEHDTGYDTVVALVRAYVDETAEAVQRLEGASDRKDLQAMEREALALKTGAGTFGATRLYQQCESLELACLAGDRVRASAIVASLPRAIQATCRLLSGRYDVSG
ncbi:MAG: response regulator [Alphaproteobacteria bacterium]